MSLIRWALVILINPLFEAHKLSGGFGVGFDLITDCFEGVRYRAVVAVEKDADFLITEGCVFFDERHGAVARPYKARGPRMAFQFGNADAEVFRHGVNDLGSGVEV